MDRLAQSPLRLSAGFGAKALKYRVQENGPSKPASRKRRLLQPLASSRSPTATATHATALPSEKTRVEFEAALRRRDFEQVLWLIESGHVAATYETHGGETALLAAIGARHEDAFRLIMECQGVSIDRPNRHGYTPLMKAIAAAAPFAEASAKPRKSLVPVAVDTGRGSFISNNLRDEDQDDDAEPFDNRMVVHVLAHKPDLHARDASGQTASDWASRTRNHAALALLEDHQRRMRAQHADFADRESQLRECIALLSRHDALALELEALLRVPLLQEARLLAFVREAPPDLTSERLENALADYAVLTNGASETVFLQDYYIGRETRDGWTPLTKAAACGFTDALQLLLARGANANHESSRHKHTALTWASCCGHEGVVLALLRRPDVDVHRKTREGKTALTHAVANGQLAVVRHLLRELHARCVARASGKQTFHYNEEAVRARRPSSWGRRPVSTARTRRKPGTEEWHDLFLEMLLAQDATGKDALAYTIGAHENDSVVLKVREELQHAIQQAQDHAAYVAEHQQRTLPTPCKFAQDGCEFVAPLDLLPTHELHECTKRRVECERCGEQVAFERREAHDRVGCVERLVPCANRPRGCTLLVAAREAEAHARDHCRKRLAPCRLGCGKVDDELTYDQRDTHETTQCPHRLVGCPNGCGAAPFRANESGVHKRKHCPKRLVQCTGGAEATGGCGLPVRVDEMAFHVTTLCVARREACKWAIHGCDVRIGGSFESRRHHENAECPFRLVACQHDCGATAMLACFVDEHVAWQCPAAPVACPKACDVGLLPRQLMDKHVLQDAGDCNQRLVRCRLDLCGKILRLYDSSDSQDDGPWTGDGSTMGALRQRLSRATAFLERLQQRHDQADDREDREEDNQDEAPFWRVAAARAQLLAWLVPYHTKLQDELRHLEAAKHASAERVRVLSFDAATQRHLLESQRDARARWLDLRGREFDVEGLSDRPGEAASSHFGCGFLAASALSAHEQSDCALRLVACPLACGQRLAAQGVAPHLAKRCNLRNATCRLGCGAVLPFLSLGEHEQDHCERREVSCDHCHATLPQAKLAAHLATLCPSVPRRCRLGCGELVPSAQFATHEANECAKRLVPCPQCDQRVWASELETTHATSECALRVFGACDSGCGVTLRVNERAHHLLFDCALRAVSCHLCHAVVAWRAMEAHKTQLCPMRRVLCRRGCGELVRDVDADAHEDHACVNRAVHCSNRCGELLPFAQLQSHLTKQCAMRVVACPSDCGDQLFAYQCATHAVRCRQRLWACGAGASGCARPIRLWVRARTLTTCKTHGETGLLWAIKRQDEDLVAYFVQAVDSAQLDLEFANGFSPLTTAATLGHLEIAKTLLRAGADVNAETSRGRTPLCEATMARDPAMVALLLEHRARVLHTNRHGQSVLAVAEAFASQAHDEKAERVLELLRAQHEMETDQRALFRAIACSDYAFVAALLQHASNDPRVTQDELETQLAQAKRVLEDVAKEVDESVALLNESIADTEAKATQATRLRERVEDCATQLDVVAQSHEASLAASSAIESELLAQIGTLTALDLAALLNAAAPPSPEWLVVMKSLCLFCGAMPRGRRNASEYSDMEWWKTAQALLMDRALLRKLRGYRQQTITPDVMAKARRECLRTPAFAAAASGATVTAQDHATPDTNTKGATPDSSVVGAPTATTALPRQQQRRGALTGDVVGRLATWVQGVEVEYRHQSERATLVDTKRRLAVSLGAHETALATTVFESQVAARSLPARQQEVQTAQAHLAAAQRALEAATQRLRAHRLVRFAALNGHTALSFACAVGNDAMVHMLLTHGARAGPLHEDREACAALIQLTFRSARFRRQKGEQDERHASRSDAAVAALVRNVAQTFLLGHYRRRRRLVLLTHRVALHEAVYNGHTAIVAMLLAQDDVSVWQKTHVFPMRVMPGVTDRVRGDPASETELRRRGGWALVPLTGDRLDPDDQEEEETVDPAVLETRLAPMTLAETLGHAVYAFDSGTFLRDRGGWTQHGETRYSETRRLVETTLERAKERRATAAREILARKSVARKTKEREALHAKLDAAIVALDFVTVSKLLDDGAFADYETARSGLTALSAACGDEKLFVANADGMQVRACAFLMDRVSNRASVDFESTTGRTALGEAAARGALQCAQELLDRGAHANYATRLRGETALMVAARAGQVDFVAFLLRHKAIDVFVKDHSGKTALDHAKDAGCHDAQALLAAAASGGMRKRVFASESALYGVCKWGCGFLAAEADHAVEDTGVDTRPLRPLDTHERNECPKRIVACPLGCDAPTLWAEHVHRHTTRECAHRRVTCAQPKCGVVVEAQHMAAHERDECDWRSVVCACGERMTHAKQVIHAANTCPERLVACPNECPDPQADDSVMQLRACEIKHHERSECSHRRVRCRNGCAANTLLAKDREVHETQRCPLRRVECKWNCGEQSVRAHAQQHHETSECLMRELACPLKCGIRVVFLSLESHTTTECAHRNVACALGCGRQVPLHTMARHEASECRRRVVVCPQQCGVSLEEGELASHLSTQCAQRLAACVQCGATGLTHAQLPAHRESQCRMRVVRCRFQCYATQPLRVHAQAQHEQFECSLRPVFCPLGCGLTLVAHTAKRHEKTCDMRIVSCAACGAEMREKDRSDHELRYCAAHGGKGGQLQRGRL